MLKRPNSTISIRSKNHLSNYIRNKNNIKFDNNNNNNIYQSPKISSGKMRYILENKKLFSLIDLNEKITNSKGTSLPKQFNRLTSEEINSLFNGNFSKVYQNLKKAKYTLLKKNLLNNIKIPEEIKNDFIFNNKLNTNNIESENNTIDDTTKNINDSTSNIQKYISYTEQGYDKKSINKKDEILKRSKASKFPYQQTVKNLIKKRIDKYENDKDNNIIKNDIWMPTNYKNYEKIVKNRKLFIQKMKENPFFNRLPSCTLKDIQYKTNNTDIFFINPPKDKTKFSYLKKLKNINNSYYNSDIFNIKNDEISLLKIGEKYLFNNRQNIKFTTSNESKSEWQSYIDKNSINNCSSKEYNILTPNRKNNNFTKEEIYNTLDETNNNKYNPIHKYKTVSKYIDLANHSSVNLGKVYMNCYNSNSNCFKKIPESCSSFGDLFLQYKNCDKLFYKKNGLL